METKSELLQAEINYIQENSLKCRLFIHSNSHQSTMAVADEENNIRIVQEKSTEDFLKEKAGILNLRFRETFVVVNAKDVSLLPEELYDEEKEALSHTFLIEKQQIRASFEASEKENFWLSILKDAKLIPSFAIVIDHLSKLVKFKTLMGIQFHEDYIEVSIFEDNHLILYNQFPAATPDEFNFFLLTLFQKFELTPALIQFFLWGNISESDSNYSRIAKYSRNISFPEPSLLIGATACV